MRPALCLALVLAVCKIGAAQPGSLAADYNRDGKASITDALSLLIDWLKGK